MQHRQGNVKGGGRRRRTRNYLFKEFSFRLLLGRLRRLFHFIDDDSSLCYGRRGNKKTKKRRRRSGEEEVKTISADIGSVLDDLIAFPIEPHHAIVHPKCHLLHQVLLFNSHLLTQLLYGIFALFCQCKDRCGLEGGQFQEIAGLIGKV